MRKFIAIVYCIFSTVAAAEKPADLLRAFKDAAMYDPLYQAQVAIYQATVQEVPKRTAVLLPQIALSADVDREYQSMPPFGSGYFNTHNYLLTASQTIFNFTQFKELEQAHYIVRSAFATLTAEQQNLILRTAQAYLDVLKFQELLIFTKQQKHYLAEQYKATKTLFDYNHATVVDLEQAKGAFDLINAELYSAKIDLYNAKQTLSEITRIRYKHFAHLKDNFPLVKPDPQDLSCWLKKANEQNFNLQASRLDIAAAREAMYAREGGFVPNISAQGQLNKALEPNGVVDKNEKNVINFIGVNASWRVFEGGLTVAQIREAAANLRRAYAQMNQQYLKTMADTRRSYTDIVLGVTRVKNIREALASNTRALKSAQEAYRAGELTITEILQIQQQLFTAQRQYAQDTYKYLVDLLELKQAAGILDVKSLVYVNQWLQ